MTENQMKRKLENSNTHYDFEKSSEDEWENKQKKCIYSFSAQALLGQSNSNVTDCVIDFQTKSAESNSTYIIKSETDQTFWGKIYNYISSLDRTSADNHEEIQKMSSENLQKCLPMANKLPAYFQVCLQCRGTNPNPNYQYCPTCFRNRFSRVEKVPKRMKLFHSETKNDFNEMLKLNNNLCNVCLVNPKNGAFNHGNLSHIYCCYTCAKKVQLMTNNCPICKKKIDKVTKLMDL